MKSYVPDFALDLSKYITRGHAGARSRGYTQIKIKGDNKGLQQIYKALNINEDNINNADKSAIATIARLAYMYNTEAKAVPAAPEVCCNVLNMAVPSGLYFAGKAFKAFVWAGTWHKATPIINNI